MAPIITSEIKTLLKASARSFYLTLQVLPKPVRTQISIAYLLARISDTISDTDAVVPQERLGALEQFYNAIQRGPATTPSFTNIISNQTKALDKHLLHAAAEAVSFLHSLPDFDRELIIYTLGKIIEGQKFDLVKFSAVSPNDPPKPVPLANDAELDKYTYLVAGCVGEFWTKLCRQHLFPTTHFDIQTALSLAIEFGQGLQLVNILRDIPRDLRRNRCYLPADRLGQHRLTAESLLDPTSWEKFRPLFLHYSTIAKQYLRAGWQYIEAIPKNQIRVRLACTWPVLIGLRTLSLLELNNPLDPKRVIKVPRSTVRKILACSVLFYPSPTLRTQLYLKAGGLPITRT